MYYFCESQKTTIISRHIIDWLVVIATTLCVYCTVLPDSQNTIQVKFLLRSPQAQYRILLGVTLFNDFHKSVILVVQIYGFCVHVVFVLDEEKYLVVAQDSIYISILSEIWKPKYSINRVTDFFIHSAAEITPTF